MCAVLKTIHKGFVLVGSTEAAAKVEYGVVIF